MTRQGEDALWQDYFTAAPVRRRVFEPNSKTVAKWRKRTTTDDAPMGPHVPRSSVLTPAEEAMIVEFRRRTLLPLDDVMGCLMDAVPKLTRSALHRCLQRHGISRLPDDTEKASKRGRFAETKIGYVHIDYCEFRHAEGRLVMFLAIDRVSKFTYVEFCDKAGKMNGAAFLRNVVQAFPYKIHTVLTDNGMAFADLPKYRSGPTAMGLGHIFDRVCGEHGIEHRLTKPYHPWTNGQAERMNRTVKDATVKAFHYEEVGQDVRTLYAVTSSDGKVDAVAQLSNHIFDDGNIVTEIPLLPGMVANAQEWRYDASTDQYVLVDKDPITVPPEGFQGISDVAALHAWAWANRVLDYDSLQRIHVEPVTPENLQNISNTVSQIVYRLDGQSSDTLALAAGITVAFISGDTQELNKLGAALGDVDHTGDTRNAIGLAISVLVSANPLLVTAETLNFLYNILFSNVDLGFSSEIVTRMQDDHFGLMTQNGKIIGTVLKGEGLELHVPIDGGNATLTLTGETQGQDAKVATVLPDGTIAVTYNDGSGGIIIKGNAKVGTVEQVGEATAYHFESGPTLLSGDDYKAVYRADDSLVAVFNHDDATGDYNIVTANDGTSTASYTVSGLVAPPWLDIDGKVRFAVPQLSMEADPVTGIATIMIGGSVLHTQGGDWVSIIDAASGSPMVTLGDITVIGNGAGGTTLSLGPLGESSVLTIPAGSFIDPLADGGISVVPSADSADFVLSGPNGIVVPLAGVATVVVHPGESGGVTATLISDSGGTQEIAVNATGAISVSGQSYAMTLNGTTITFDLSNGFAVLVKDGKVVILTGRDENGNGSTDYTLPDGTKLSIQADPAHPGGVILSRMVLIDPAVDAAQNALAAALNGQAQAWRTDVLSLRSQDLNIRIGDASTPGNDACRAETIGIEVEIDGVFQPWGESTRLVCGDNLALVSHSENYTMGDNNSLVVDTYYGVDGTGTITSQFSGDLPDFGAFSQIDYSFSQAHDTGLLSDMFYNSVTDLASSYLTYGTVIDVSYGSPIR